jgi:hypothetical protein
LDLIQIGREPERAWGAEMEYVVVHVQVVENAAVEASGHADPG